MRDYVHSVPDGKGGFYNYFRVKGQKPVKLPRDKSSPEYKRELDRLIATMKPPVPRRVSEIAARIKPKSVATVCWAIERYLVDNEFTKLAPRSQYNYRFALEVLRRQKVDGVELDHLPLADLAARHVKIYIASIIKQFGEPTARLHRQLLANLWTCAETSEDFDAGDKVNPVRGTKAPYKTAEEPHEPWPDHVVEEFLAKTNAPMQTAYYLLYYTAQRGCDVVKMRWSDFDGERIHIKTQKTKRKMSIKCPKVLLNLLHKLKATRTSDYILTHSRGERYGSAQSLSQRIRENLDKIGADDYSMHGLRCNAGILLAENGATMTQIMERLGHSTTKMAAHYIRLADARRLSDQTADIIDRAVEAKRTERVQAKRAALQVV